jgi:hypothetical protein
MATDTERGLTELLEARRNRIVTHTNVEDVRIKEFRAFIDLALAADRRRQAEDACSDRFNNDHDYDDCMESFGLDPLEVNAALDNLLAHLAGEGI